ncbi:phosphatidylserine decarboxylase family protein [Desulfopila sp. IMCC35008]|uniref:phosphatidylserine decarboxylase family protein n=1 Tax=Desulfopila sp. IMCC35008 TaxID=2653858 RepID=UPI0013CFF27C|nr:phosphatidylserine decarboxylase family protein [Desulfopila sp. IMCC35008]
MLKPKVPVAKEGYPFIGGLAFTTLFFTLQGISLPAWLFFIATLFSLAFFRDPERFIPPAENEVVSPADGRIIIAEPVTDDTFTQSRAYKISIFMNVFNVHVNRAPLSGNVDQVIYRAGKFYAADSEKGGLQNEYCGVVMSHTSGYKIAFVQIAGLIARRIVCWLEPDDKIERGHRFGLIRFGSRVDLYLPENSDIRVQVGQKVRAGESILAAMPQEKSGPSSSSAQS